MRDSQSPLTIAQLRGNTLSGAALFEIERMILSGELPAGSRLNENAIATKLGVSRGPIREACRTLFELGILELVPGKGAFVKEVSVEDAKEIYNLRAGLLGLAGRLLAPTVTDDQIRQLEALVDAMRLAASQWESAEFLVLNGEFHALTVEFTGNTRLIKIYSSVVKEFSLFRAHGISFDGFRDESNEEHARLLAAIVNRDPEEAYAASFDHVMNGKQRMIAALEKLRMHDDVIEN